MSSGFKELFNAYDTGFCFDGEEKLNKGNQTLDRGKFPVVDQLTPVEEQVWTLYKQGKSRRKSVKRWA